MVRFLLAAGLACVAAAAQTTEADLKSVLEQQQAAWNRGDLEAFMQTYEPSNSITFVGKRVTRGFNNVLENYRRGYPTRERMGTLTFSELEVKPMGQDHAAVIGRFTLDRTAAAGGAATGLFTVLLRKTDAGWKIVHDHTSSQ